MGSLASSPYWNTLPLQPSTNGQLGGRALSNPAQTGYEGQPIAETQMLDGLKNVGNAG
jgi:hypothetical protein